jgi:acyl-CoA thioesterase II
MPDSAPAAGIRASTPALDLAPAGHNFGDEFRLVRRATDVAEGRCLAGRSGRIYGGQLLAQASMAAHGSAGSTWRPHSVSAHFLRAGVPSEAVRYRMQVLHRSRHFQTTRVDAEQQHGIVATVVLSTHHPRQTAGHQASPPLLKAGLPDDMPPAAGGPIPDPDAPIRRPFELRHASLVDGQGDDGRPRFAMWVRLRRGLADPAGNAAALIWLSDFALTRIADLEHENRPGARRAASLHHAMWLHRPTDLADWHVYVVTSPAYCDGLALSSGHVFRQSGELVASVSQESMLWRA